MTREAQGDAPHALVVDDALILMGATSILEDAGFRVLEAMSIAQAVVVLERNHEAVQLLFTDVPMPGDGDGFALARQTAERWPHIAGASGEAWTRRPARVGDVHRQAVRRRDRPAPCP
ncbi:response regulator [Methylobacterium sp. J-026]|uniref:response regulator n=1 Tax=Methylobacterium sp. J-026 TaxID=2836624 RepID=UPI0028C39DFB|nr:response regulator [Methylobacterium sp. J-026]